jgi:hypothetical protein
MIGAEHTDGDEDEGPGTISGYEAPPLSALDLLALASRAAAQVACEQSIAVEAAARLLERTALSEGTVWVAGDAADEHTRRLEAAGHRAIAIVDPNRLPSRLSSADLLFVTAVTEVPAMMLVEAKRRNVDTIVLRGAERIDDDGAVVIRVKCYDQRAVELTHCFIVTALCSPCLDVDRAESAA